MSGPELSNIFMAYDSVTDAWLPAFGYFVSAERAKVAIQKEEYRRQNWNNESRTYEFSETVQEVELRRSNWKIVEVALNPIEFVDYVSKRNVKG